MSTMSTTHKKRSSSEINVTPNYEPQAKKRKTVDAAPLETAILEFTNLSKDILGDDVVYFIQKDYNIEGRFFEPRFLELSRENAIKLVKQSPIDIDGDAFKCQLYDGKLPFSFTRRHHSKKHKSYEKYDKYEYEYRNEYDYKNEYDSQYEYASNGNSRYEHDTHSKYSKYNKYNEPPAGSCGYTVWIGNICKKASKPYLISILQEFGEILNVYVLSQSLNQYNCAFVDFLSPFDVLAVGKAVFYHKLKIYDVPVSAVLREKTIDRLFVNGYQQQLREMVVDYGMLNTKHGEYYNKLCSRYWPDTASNRSKSRHRHRRRKRDRDRDRDRDSADSQSHSCAGTDSHSSLKSDFVGLSHEIEDGEIIKDGAEAVSNANFGITPMRNSGDETVSAVGDMAAGDCDAEIAVLKHGIMRFQEKKKNILQDLQVLGNCELISGRITSLTHYNAELQAKSRKCKQHIGAMKNKYSFCDDNVYKQRSRLYSMKQQFSVFVENHDSVLAQWNKTRTQWLQQQLVAKQENSVLLQEFSTVTQQVRDETDVFEKVDVERKAKHARHSVLRHKIEAKKKEINLEEKKYNKCCKMMEDECNSVKLRFETEQKQHENTQQVLADTVCKVKESIKSINKRAKEKDLIIKRLQNRLKLYKHHLNGYAIRDGMVKETGNNSNSKVVSIS